MANDEAVIVYEEVLDDLLTLLRENVLNRREAFAVPDGGAIKAVQRRCTWVVASEKDLEETRQLTLIGSADDVETREALRERVRASLLDMAAWLVDERLMRQCPRARTRLDIAKEQERELLEEAERAARRAAQPELLGTETHAGTR